MEATETLRQPVICATPAEWGMVRERLDLYKPHVEPLYRDASAYAREVEETNQHLSLSGVSVCNLPPCTAPVESLLNSYLHVVRHDFEL